LGVLAVENLPKRKAGEVKINVGFAIDENETLKIEAKFVCKGDDDMVTESELYEMGIDRVDATKVSGNEGNMILEAQKFKDDDNEVLRKANETNDLIDLIRNTCNDLPEQIETLASVNQVVDDINKNEENLSDTHFKEFINRLILINKHMLALNAPIAKPETEDEQHSDIGQETDVEAERKDGQNDENESESQNKPQDENRKKKYV
jgi:molecular chaperone DnaK (HSP70)